MADEQVETEAPVETTNGAADRSKMTRAEQEAADREEFLAWDGDGEDDAGDAPAPKADKKKPVVQDDDEDEDEVESAADEGDEDDDLELDDEEDRDEEDDQDEDDDEDEEPAAKQDPELAKRLAKVQKYEKRVRDQADARERQFAQERDAFVSEWKPKVEAYEAFEKAKSRKDAVGIIKSAGFTEDDFADLSKIFFGLSKEAAADPKNREAVARMQRERELREENKALEARLAKLEGKLTKSEEEAVASQTVDKYLGRVEKAIGDDTPLVKKRLELMPKSTRKAIALVAHQLATKAGDFVDPKKVTRAYEKKLGRALEQASKLRGEQAGAAAAAAPAKKKASAIIVEDKTKKGASETAPKKTTNGSSKALLPSREEMIEDLKKIDRGEIDPDAD